MEDIDGKKEEMSQRMNIRLPLIEKYRPNSLDEVISHDDIVNTLNRFIEQQKLPHLLFYGPPGTGNIYSTAYQTTPPSFHSNIYIYIYCIYMLYIYVVYREDIMRVGIS